MSNCAGEVLHNCYIDFYGVKPTSGVVNRTYELLPNDIKWLATEWGWNDTVVRNRIYIWMMEKDTNF